jgi:hypothetical protein
MMQIVSTQKNIGMVVFTIGKTIHFTPLELYNKYCANARSPKFEGTFDECVKYVHEVL